MTDDASRPSRAERTSRQTTRATILDAAGTLFAKQGVAQTTIDEIAEGAGVSSGSVYRHFGGKQEILVAFIDEGLTLVEGYLEEARQAESPIQRIYGAGDAYFRFAVEFPIAARFAAIRVLQPAVGPELEAVNDAFGERMHRSILSVAGDIKAAMDAGELVPAPIADTMIFLWGTWNGVAALMLRQDAVAISPEAAASALELGRKVMRTAIAYAKADPDAADEAAQAAPPPTWPHLLGAPTAPDASTT